MLPEQEGNHAHAQYAITDPTVPVSQIPRVISIPYNACKWTDVFGIERSINFLGRRPFGSGTFSVTWF
jgi:hypothetical protein